MKKRLVSWFLIVTILCSLFVAFPTTSYALSNGTLNGLVPIWTYPAADESFPVYSTVDCTTKSGTIYKNDYCKITKFYKNDDDKYIVKVTYPTSSGNKTGYAKAIRFIPNCYESFSAVQKTANAKTYVSTKAGAATNSGWYISSGDKFYVIERDGNGNSQVVYPISGGYKMGWIKYYNVKYNANSGTGAPSTQVKTQNVNLGLSSTKPTRSHYIFNSWNTSKDGSGTKYSAGATYKGNKAITLYAQWSRDSHKITVTSNNASWGTVSGGGTYTCGTSVTLKATPKTGYKFVKWSNGSTSASISVSASSNATYTATFAPIPYAISVKSASANMGTVSGAGTYNYGTSITIKATPKTGHTFSKWNDGNKSASRSVSVSGNATYTAYFTANNYTISTSVYNITSGTFDSSCGTVSGSGTYSYGTSVTLKATPNSGYAFSKWSDGNTNASRTVSVTGATTYTAQFVKTVCEHAYETWTISQNPTCTEVGQEYSICSNCKESTSYREIEAKGHDFINGTKVTESEATCTTDGYSYYICANCAEKGLELHTKALGHLIKTKTLPATCTESGEIIEYCTLNCGYSVPIDIIDAIGHNHVLDEDASTDKYLIYSCSNDGCEDSYNTPLYNEDYTFSFKNERSSFGRAKIVNLFPERLFLTAFGWNKNVAHSYYNDNKHWDGVCFGMSATSLAFFTNNLEISEYSDSDTVYGIEAPSTTYVESTGYFTDERSANLRDIIEFFQVSQFTEDIRIEYSNNASNVDNNWENIDSKLIPAVQNFVENGSDGLIIRMGRTSSQGVYNEHAVIPLDIEDCVDYYNITVYDNMTTEFQELKVYKSSSGVTPRFTYNNGLTKYDSLISFNYFSTIYELMLKTIRSETSENAEITDVLSYANIFVNSKNVEVMDSNGVDVTTLDDVYIMNEPGENKGKVYLLPQGEYSIENNDSSVTNFEVSIIGNVDSKTVKSKNHKVVVGIDKNKKTTYAKARRNNVSRFSVDEESSLSDLTIVNISNDGIQDIIQTDADYIELDTSADALDIISDKDSVVVNGDTLELEEAITLSSTSSNSYMYTSESIGYSSDAIVNEDTNYTVSVKTNNLVHSNNNLSGDLAFNIYNNTGEFALTTIKTSVYSNSGEFIGSHSYEYLLGNENNYVIVEGINIEIPEGTEFYVVSSLYDTNEVLLSNEVEVSLDTEPEYSLRYIAGTLEHAGGTYEEVEGESVYIEKVIRGDILVNAHSKTGESRNATAFLCFYDSNGRLLEIMQEDLVLSDNNNDVYFTEISVPCETDGWYVKCMLWSDTSTLVPLSTALYIPLSEGE